MTSIILTAILTLAPTLPREQAERYAEDIESAAANDDGELDVELGMALVVTQDAESTWRESVESCRITGDDGRAVGAFQIHKHWWNGHTRAEICASNRLSAALAARSLRTLRTRTGGNMARAMRSYIGCAATDIRVVRRVRRHEQLMLAARKAA
jgi:hypothetical protein